MELKKILLELAFGLYPEDLIDDIPYKILTPLENILVDVYSEVEQFYYDNGYEGVTMLSRDWDDYQLVFDRENSEFTLNSKFEVVRENPDFNEEDEDSEPDQVVDGTININFDGNFNMTGKSYQLNW